MTTHLVVVVVVVVVLLLLLLFLVWVTSSKIVKALSFQIGSG